jgi:hypothetical protein
MKSRIVRQNYVIGLQKPNGSVKLRNGAVKAARASPPARILPPAGRTGKENFARIRPRFNLDIAAVSTVNRAACADYASVPVVTGKGKEQPLKRPTYDSNVLSFRPN